ncbi:MAG: hypothetical protein ACJ749_10265, partial [Flavisolibacter sp.]
IPQNIYKFTIPKSQLVSNPIVPVVNEISDLNMNRDLDFYFNTSEIKLSGSVDAKSLKASIFNSNDNGFDLKLSLNLPQIVVNGARLSLCEDKQRNTKNCGSGLKATMNQLKITTVTRPVVLTMVLRLKTDGKVGRVTVRSVDSNLDDKVAPGLDINFKSLDIPKISIVINGQETELDTSRLKSEILKRKTFLAKKLLSFAGDFIANDVAEMINVYLVNKSVATSYQVFKKENGPVHFDEFINTQTQLHHDVDGTYVRKPMMLYPMPHADPMASMMSQISDVIRSAQLGISLKKIATPGNKDVELAGLVGFILNGQQINVRNTLGNSNRQLPGLNLDAQRNNDITLAISEPLLNGALDVANSTHLFQELFEALSPVPGFSIRSVKLHFQNERAMVAVVNAQVDLKKIKSKGVTSWFKNRIAAWLERNNNNSVIYFPIEVAVAPVFKKLPNGGTGLDLKVFSPFNYVNLPNRYNYPSNVPDMTETVKDGVMEELKTSLEPYVNKTYNVDVTSFLNQSGVIFQPKSISIIQNAYLMLNLDITDIKFNSKNPNQR